MSLFGDDQFQWRKTYFVMFREGDRPQAKEVVQGLSGGDHRFHVHDVREDAQGRLESLTLTSPDQ